MSQADDIRAHATAAHVAPARRQGLRSFSIRVGDIVREKGLAGRVPAVCSALKGRKFLEANHLRLAGTPTGPASGQSTTVVYTYEFTDMLETQPLSPDEAWKNLRGALKDVYSSRGGGEAWLRREREQFYDPGAKR